MGTHSGIPKHIIQVSNMLWMFPATCILFKMFSVVVPGMDLPLVIK